MKSYSYLLLLLNIFNIAKSNNSSNGYFGRYYHPWSVYYATGIIYHPELNLSEPFQAWYDETQKASRIDYYDGNFEFLNEI